MIIQPQERWREIDEGYQGLWDHEESFLSICVSIAKEQRLDFQGIFPFLFRERERCVNRLD